MALPVAVPLQSPKQVTLVLAVMDTVGAPVLVTQVVAVAVHPLRSVTVTV